MHALAARLQCIDQQNGQGFQLQSDPRHSVGFLLNPTPVPQKQQHHQHQHQKGQEEHSELTKNRKRQRTDFYRLLTPEQAEVARSYEARVAAAQRSGSTQQQRRLRQRNGLRVPPTAPTSPPFFESTTAEPRIPEFNNFNYESMQRKKQRMKGWTFHNLSICSNGCVIETAFKG